MKDDRFRAFTVLVAVFLIGAIVGATGSYLWLQPSAGMARSIDGRFPPPPNRDSRFPPPPPGNEQQPLKLPDLGLTPEQEEKWGQIWKETREKMEALMHEQRGNMIAGEKMREEIWAENERKARAVLNDEQKVKYDIWLEKMRTWREQGPRRRGPESSPKENFRKPEPPNDNFNKRERL